MKLFEDKSAVLKRLGQVAKYISVAALGALAYNIRYFLVLVVVLAPLFYWFEVQADAREDAQKSRTQLTGIFDIDSNGTVIQTDHWNQADAERVSQMRDELLDSLNNSNQISGNFRHLMSALSMDENRSREEFCQEVDNWFSQAIEKQIVRRHAYVTQELNLPIGFAFQHDGVISPREIQVILDFPSGTEIWMDRAVANSENAGMNTPDLFNRRRIRVTSPLMQLGFLDTHALHPMLRSDVQVKTSETGTTLIQTFSNVFVGTRCITHPFFVSTTSSSEHLTVRWTVSSTELHGSKVGQILIPASYGF